MNRQTKRLMQRQGQVGPDGAPVAQQRRQPRPAPRPTTKERTNPAEFFRQVRTELRKVAWPTRDEVARYSFIVLFTLIVLTSFIFGLDWVSAKAVFYLFKK